MVVSTPYPSAWAQDRMPWKYCSDCGRPVSQVWSFCVGCRTRLHQPPPSFDDDDSSSEAGDETTEATRRPPPDDNDDDDRQGGAGRRSLKARGNARGSHVDDSAATDSRTGTGTARARSRSPSRQYLIPPFGSYKRWRRMTGMN